MKRDTRIRIYAAIVGIIVGVLVGCLLFRR